MKIAFVSDDHQTISAHFGRAQFYEIFTIEAGSVTHRESLARSFPQLSTLEAGSEPGGGHHRHDHNAMIAPLAGCQALITRGMGTGAYLSLPQQGITPIITDIGEIQSALDAYITGTLVDHPERLH